MRTRSTAHHYGEPAVHHYGEPAIHHYDEPSHSTLNLNIGDFQGVIKWVSSTAANRLIGEVLQSRRWPLLWPSPG